MPAVPSLLHRLPPLQLLPPLFILFLIGLNETVGDSAAPYFHPGYPRASSITGSTFVLNVQVTETGIAHYAVVNAETGGPNGDGGSTATVPNPSEVRAGLPDGYAGRAAIAVGSLAVTANVESHVLLGGGDDFVSGRGVGFSGNERLTVRGLY